ncbi:Ribosomal RNA small subunit methyltransferase F [Babesia sp. Xinjiang]|uniref:Ribosomal RNA small subunit methyltransferase F n=1 Tax=Babesia sp. Xinjiang TaxID=462227 RepID=UPI000A265192|nr:Ribosomal RNA small subunit methyltransferase F [Babesia sp. Xinjiang]ORM41273.1 Ribosomal RNA small subunit methyltransferase F [Babesia sp. Xinjiang]
MCRKRKDVQSTKMPTDSIEEEGPKRIKSETRENNIQFIDDCVLLPPAVKSWLSHIGVNTDKYARTLYQIANGRKKRYYRVVSYTGSAQRGRECTEDSLSTARLQEMCQLDTEYIHTTEAKAHSTAYSCDEQPAQHYVNGVIRDGSCEFERISRQTPRDPVVTWLRDVTLHECYGIIPEGAVGLDAASAAVVDALRLYELTEQSGTKWILDMCCAPGGKLLGMVSSLKHMRKNKGNWKLIGLDMVKRRLDVCASLLKKESAVDNIEVHLLNCRGQDFTEFEGEFMFNRFDRILVDAECTHEGSLRSVLRTLKYWGAHSLESRFTPAHASSIICNQRELLRHALKLIRPGGLVVYSTCSLHDEQNELLVANVLREFDNVRLRQLPILSCRCCSPTSARTGIWPASSTESLFMQHCHPRYLPDRNIHGQKHQCDNTESPICVRFDPLGPETDGIFIAAITKNGN